MAWIWGKRNLNNVILLKLVFFINMVKNFVYWKTKNIEELVSIAYLAGYKTAVGWSQQPPYNDSSRTSPPWNTASVIKTKVVFVLGSKNIVEKIVLEATEFFCCRLINNILSLSSSSSSVCSWCIHYSIYILHTSLPTLAERRGWTN